MVAVASAITDSIGVINAVVVLIVDVVADGTKVPDIPCTAVESPGPAVKSSGCESSG